MQSLYGKFHSVAWSILALGDGGCLSAIKGIVKVMVLVRVRVIKEAVRLVVGDADGQIFTRLRYRLQTS